MKKITWQEWMHLSWNEAMAFTGMVVHDSFHIEESYIVAGKFVYEYVFWRHVREEVKGTEYEAEMLAYFLFEKRLP